MSWWNPTHWLRVPDKEKKILMLQEILVYLHDIIKFTRPRYTGMESLESFKQNKKKTCMELAFLIQKKFLQYVAFHNKVRERLGKKGDVAHREIIEKRIEELIHALDKDDVAMYNLQIGLKNLFEKLLNLVEEEFDYVNWPPKPGMGRGLG